MYQELRLFLLLDVRVAKIGGVDCGPIDLVPILYARPELRVPSSSIRAAKSPTATRGACPGYDCVEVRLQMNDRALATSIGQFRVIGHMNDIQHNRPGAKVEWDILRHSRSPRPTPWVQVVPISGVRVAAPPPIYTAPIYGPTRFKTRAAVPPMISARWSAVRNSQWTRYWSRACL